MSDSTPLAKTCPHMISRGRLGKDKLIFLIHMTFAMKLMFQKSFPVLFFLLFSYIQRSVWSVPSISVAVLGLTKDPSINRFNVILMTNYGNRGCGVFKGGVQN